MWNPEIRQRSDVVLCTIIIYSWSSAFQLRMISGYIFIYILRSFAYPLFKSFYLTVSPNYLKVNLPC